ncbi:protein phosphatase 2C domain-containing protein [Rhodopirellula sp.]|nr:protein phosphatase 2C domain-containing protein [Rhodopirellula sp.]MDB4679140.1 protein phosphatase 2C domain-containing protein [Rhodopirellula sp.]
MTTTELKPEFYLERDMAAPDLLSFPEGKVVAYCRRCPGKEEPNDDSAAVIRTPFGGIVLAVADGVGGGPFGYKASAIAVQVISDSLAGFEKSGDMRPAILDGIEKANREILDLGVGAATTLSVVEIQGGVARAYQVGDSMALMVGQRGALKWKSTLHSPVGYAVESGLLDEREAMQHDERHLVSNLVGSREMRIEIGPAQLISPKDTVIVGSDGLFDNLHLDEVIQLGRIGKPIARVERLANHASGRMALSESQDLGKPDDLAVLLYTR